MYMIWLSVKSIFPTFKVCKTEKDAIGRLFSYIVQHSYRFMRLLRSPTFYRFVRFNAAVYNVHLKHRNLGFVQG